MGSVTQSAAEMTWFLADLKFKRAKMKATTAAEVEVHKRQQAGQKGQRGRGRLSGAEEQVV